MANIDQDGHRDTQMGSNATLPRLHLPRSNRKKVAPKLKMNIPTNHIESATTEIFTNTQQNIVSKPESAMPILPPMKNTSNQNSSGKTKKTPLALNLNHNNSNGTVLNCSDLTATGSLPSAATTLTAASISTLNDDSGLASCFNNKLKLEELEDVVSGVSDPYRTPTATNFEDPILTKAIELLSEYEWKVLHERGLIKHLETLGEGNGGSVSKCETITKNPGIFALKVIAITPKPDFRKQMIRELNYNRKFDSPYIVKFYGTFVDDENYIHICMEYMGGRSLDAVYKNFRERDGRLSEKPLGKIAESVLKGLTYLNENKVMHRDIKPQNILLDNQGNVKICDFGVSGDVVDSSASTFTGTFFYMAPERFKSTKYTISCDVWSLGLTVLEGALGHFPFVNKDTPSLEVSPVDIIMMIEEFQPKLDDEPEEGIEWSKGFKDFTHVCLIKDGHQRPSPRQMLEHPWLLKISKKTVRMDKLVEYCWG